MLDFKTKRLPPSQKALFPKMTKRKLEDEEMDDVSPQQNKRTHTETSATISFSDAELSRLIYLRPRGQTPGMKGPHHEPQQGNIHEQTATMKGLDTYPRAATEEMVRKTDVLSDSGDVTIAVTQSGDAPCVVHYRCDSRTHF
jgi:hypothetical protein